MSEVIDLGQIASIARHPPRHPSGQWLEIFFAPDGKSVDFVHMHEQGRLDFDEGKRLSEMKELFVRALATERRTASATA